MDMPQETHIGGMHFRCRCDHISLFGSVGSMLQGNITHYDKYSDVRSGPKPPGDTGV